VDCDGTIYIGSRDFNLRAINRDGSLKWRSATDGAIDSSPSIGSDGTLYVGSGDGKLYAINPDDGSLKWSVPFPSDYPVSSSPAIGSDGKVYALTRDLRVINPDGTVEDTINLYEDKEGSSPIIRNGVLYTSTTSILAYKIPSENLADNSWPVFRHDLKHTGRVACDAP
jgi:outer membrane protein assembly factor BamB